LIVCSWCAAAGLVEAADPPVDSVARAGAYLAHEVPRWRAANNCYACHNNADAVRALDAARRQGYDVADETLADSIRWLHRVDDWGRNGGDGEFNDYELAAIQFATALVTVTAPREGAAPRTEAAMTAIRAAALRVAGFQRDDGSWLTGPGASIGSPATYGSALATATAVEVLTISNDPSLTVAINEANHWLDRFEPSTVFDAAAILYGRAAPRGRLPEPQRRACLDLLTTGRHADGGWGPYVNSSSEAFDTALVLLAISRLPVDEQPPEWIDSGRQFLIAIQYDDGSWPETTRPAGRETYAQRVSTTAWATMALLATDMSK
jgi:hypothetical protein